MTAVHRLGAGELLANCQGAGHLGTAHTLKCVEAAFAKGGRRGAIVIDFSEVQGVDVAKHAPDDWTVVQDTHNLASSRAEVALAVLNTRVRIDHHQIRELTAPTSEGRAKTGHGIGARSAIDADLTFDPGTPGAWSEPHHAGHAPPLRAAHARAAYLHELLHAGGVRGGDLNVAHRMLARLAPKASLAGIGVLWFVIPKRFTHSKPVRIDIGSDHPAVFVTIHPKDTR